MPELHESHVLRFAPVDSRTGYACINCRKTDVSFGNWGALAEPCPKPVGKGGITKDEWLAAQVRRSGRFSFRSSS